MKVPRRIYGNLPDPAESENESAWRQRILRDYTRRGKVYVECNFDPFGTPYHPAINGKPADVAEWLRQLASDIEGLGGS